MPIPSILTRIWSNSASPRQPPINILAKNRSLLPDFVQVYPTDSHCLDLAGPLPWTAFAPRTRRQANFLSRAAFLAGCVRRLKQRMSFLHS